MNIATLSEKLQPNVERKITHERHRLQLLSQRIDSVNPERLLRLGYSLTYKNGHIVRNANELSKGDEIVTRMETGSVKSIVK